MGSSPIIPIEAYAKLLQKKLLLYISYTLENKKKIKLNYVYSTSSFKLLYNIIILNELKKHVPVFFYNIKFKMSSVLLFNSGIIAILNKLRNCNFGIQVSYH